MTAYHRLREIGVSVETADALATALDGMSRKKVDAFIFWASGMRLCDISKDFGMSRTWANKTIEKVCKNMAVLV